jgi:hypothetical protein
MYFDKVRQYLKKLSSNDFERYIGIVKKLIKDETGRDVRVRENIENFINGSSTPYFDYYLRAIDYMERTSAIQVLEGRHTISHWRDLIVAATLHAKIPDDIAVHLNDPVVAREVSALFQELINACSDPSKDLFRQNLATFRRAIDIANRRSKTKQESRGTD